MYRVLLVDDEYYVRKSIVNRVDWSALGLSVCAQAQNGQQALEMMADCAPHIAIVDVRMPVMDGLQFIGHAKKLNPALRCVILSGYKDFGYAQTAIKLQADDYLLKPVEPAMLAASLLRLTQVLDRSVPELPPAIGQDSMALSRWLSYPWPADTAMPQVLRDTEVVLMLAYRRSGWDANAPQQVCAALQAACGDLRCAAALCEGDRGELRMLIHGPGATEAAALTLAREVQAKHPLSGAIIAVSAATTNASMAPVYPAAVKALQQHVISGEPHVLAASSVPDAPGEDESLAVSLLSERFYDASRAQDRSRAEQALMEMFARRWSCPDAVRILLSGIMTTLQQYLLRRHLSMDVGLENALTQPLFRRYDVIDQLRRELVRSLLPLLFQDTEDRSLRTAEQVRVYIDDHIAGDLRVESIAKEFFISSSYLSQIFKAQTSVPISSYIEDRRIERSKALLLQNRLTITEIAARAGYQDPAYFSRAFKRCTGMTPKKYQTTNMIKR